MRNIDLYLKLELDLPESEKPERFADELCRMLKKVYGVRKAEVSNLINRNEG
jgi:hypothetical protein